MRHRVTDVSEKEMYLRGLMAMLDVGRNKNARSRDLENLFNDVKYEYLKLTVRRPPSPPPMS